jgi:1-deoxy-D-xylulose-5-phosphate reductoisomerase
MQKLAILGSTGSIGRSALSLVDLYPDRFEVVALAANRNADLLHEQATRYRPALVALHDQEAAATLSRQLPGTRVSSGAEGLVEVSCHAEATVVLSSIMGAAGLLPTYHAIKEGKKIALANKETLVMAGELLVHLARQQNSQLLPVDSEHSALHQCLRGAKSTEVRRLLLTASGGPFVNSTRDSMVNVTVEQALDHPTWEMGPKITVDSATLMNKGLEVIEAHHFFGFSPDQISVAIHPQSVIHSIVEFIDGTMLAQMSITDMKTSLLYAFAYPERWESRLPELNLFSLPELSFEGPDTERFPCLDLAYQALRAGGSCPAAMNAANEVAVGLFLDGQLPFLRIPELIDETLEAHQRIEAESLETVLEVDRHTREEAMRLAGQRGWVQI